MKMTATTHIPRQSANNHLFLCVLFCSFGVRNIIFVVIFFPFHQTTLSLNCHRATHLSDSFTYCASFASSASTRASSDRVHCQSTAVNLA